MGRSRTRISYARANRSHLGHFYVHYRPVGHIVRPTCPSRELDRLPAIHRILAIQQHNLSTFWNILGKLGMFNEIACELYKQFIKLGSIAHSASPDIQPTWLYYTLFSGLNKV